MAHFFKPAWRKIVLIIAVSFLSRLLVYGYIRIPWIIFDEFIYLDTARQIIRGNFMSLLSRDPQLYPTGWPMILAALTGFIKNPFWQYKAGLIVVSLISSLVPLLAFWLTGSFWVSLLVSFYPPLFVYSSSLMSETFFIFMLLVLVAVLKYIIKDDFAKRSTLILAAVLFGFFIFYTRMIRSFGIILLPAYVLAAILVGYFQYRQGSLNRLKNLLFFTVLTVFSYYLFNYFGQLWFMPKDGYYERSAYFDALVKALKQPRFSFVLLRNELTLSLYWLLFVLPIFSYIEGVKELHKKEWHLLLPRIWAVLIYIFSLGLTLAHMFIGTKNNPQYLVFSRYLDPALVLLFIYGAADFYKYLTSSVKLKIPAWVFVLLGYFVFYFIFKLPKLDYKFGNTMSVYFFLLFKEQVWLSIILILLVGFIFYCLWKNKRQLLFYALLFFFGWTALFSINNTLSTPEHVMNKYKKIINEWQSALRLYPTTDIPLCIHHNGISSETYYLYHFLNPYQYLRRCQRYEKKPKRILTKKDYSFALPVSCSYDFRFDNGESIIYCPLGY